LALEEQALHKTQTTVQTDLTLHFPQLHQRAEVRALLTLVVLVGVMVAQVEAVITKLQRKLEVQVIFHLPLQHKELTVEMGLVPQLIAAAVVVVLAAQGLMELYLATEALEHHPQLLEYL
jgi:hypothetical protein